MSTQPTTHRQDLVEDLHGHRIADPYRWLEDPDSEQTRAWVDAQNVWTEEHLAGLPERAWFTETLDQVLGQPRAGLPFHRYGRWFVTRNDGRQDQDQWFVADSLEELQAGGRLIIDPNRFDGASSVSSVTVSRDGKLLAYGRSDGGSDWVHFVILDLDTGEPLADEADVVGKFHAAVWLPDHTSFLYQGYPQSDRADGTDTTALGAAQLRRHRLGTPVSQDEVVLELPDEPEVAFGSRVSHDEQWVVVTLHHGTEDRNRLWLLPLSPRRSSGGVGESGSGDVGEPVRLIDETIARFDFVRMLDREVVLSTNLGAGR
ncbi:MAG TPA: S9 family peptidase, partial [Candidatus Avipropionibacterium avicola]|nr:S9 family peptidase [Candidatus Avipropionibacterium avicola]